MKKTKTPSFSSTLLDQIYRSIDDGDQKRSGELKFYRDSTMSKKQSIHKTSVKIHTAIEEEEMKNLKRACLIEKWVDKKIGEKFNCKNRDYPAEFDAKSQHDPDRDQDALFFSSTSISSDSSSGTFSSSDNESMFSTKPIKASCFSYPKPIRTSVSAKPDKTEKKQRNMFYDDYFYCSGTEQTPKKEEFTLNSKSRALKIYGSLKKVKQPISPGGRLTSFINSLFTNTKKTKNSSSSTKSEQPFTCSSATSFSRSCLSKNSSFPREKLHDEVKRTVRFYPVSVIIDEDCKPCGQKSLYEEEDSRMTRPTSLTTEKKFRRGDEGAREFLREFHRNQKKNNDMGARDFRRNEEIYGDEDHDDAASDSSSDLFELDHLSVMGHGRRYCEELPVYETTRVGTNRAISNRILI